MSLAQRNKIALGFARRGVAARRTVSRVAASAARQAVASSRYNNYRVGANAAMAKFASRGYRRGEEVRCLDLQFTGAYADAYTADTQPCQILNLNTGTACVQAINLAQQGVGVGQRLGNKVSLKSLRLRLSISPVKAVAQDAVTFSRVMVLYDRNPNAGYVAINSILGESLQSNTIGTGTYVSNLNPNFFDRFVVLMDKMLTLQPYNAGVLTSNSVTGTTQKEDYMIDEFIRLKDLETVYNGTANPMTIAQINTGALLIATFGNTAAAGQPWGMIGTARLRFRDN